MRWWPFGRRAPVETRQAQGGAGFTDAVVSALLAQAAGGTGADAGATAALEAAAGAYARAFALCEVTPVTPATAALTPALLALGARDLIRRGEFVWQIEVAPDGRVRLLPGGSWDVRGGPDPATWTYRLDLFGPSGNTTRLLPGAAVLHGRYSFDPARPWWGVSPLGWARLSAKLHAATEDALADESAGTRGHLLPVPEGPAEDGDDDDTEDPNAQLRADILGMKGRTLMVETTAGAWKGDQADRPRHDWQPRRIGANPPQGLTLLRSESALAVLAACGVPPSMVDGRVDGTAQRESWRRFLHGSLLPLGELLADELGAKLDAPGLKLSFDRLMASDLSGRARAFQSLTRGGMELAKAAALSGMMEGE